MFAKGANIVSEGGYHMRLPGEIRALIVHTIEHEFEWDNVSGMISGSRLDEETDTVHITLSHSMSTSQKILTETKCSKAIKQKYQKDYKVKLRTF